MAESQQVRSKCAMSRKLWIKLTSFGSDFGAIFAELLPGNYAKLQPPEGQDLMDGLEVKVRLGSVWKQSLTELSGGQRYVFDRADFGGPKLTRPLQLSHCTILDHGTSAIQTCTDVYPGRDRRSSGSVTHATYRSTIQKSLQGLTIYCRQSQRGSVHKRKCSFQDKIQGWH